MTVLWSFLKTFPVHFLKWQKIVTGDKNTGVLHEWQLAQFS